MKLKPGALDRARNYIRSTGVGLVPQHLMRNTVSLTTKTCISSARLPLAEAIKCAPRIVSEIENRHIYRDTKTSHALSFGVAGCHESSTRARAQHPDK